MSADIRPGDYVRHSLGQEGKVVRVTNGSVTIIFDDDHAVLAAPVSGFTRIDPQEEVLAHIGVPHYLGGDHAAF